MKLQIVPHEQGDRLIIDATPAEIKALMLGGILAMDKNVDPFRFRRSTDGSLVVDLSSEQPRGEELLQYLTSKIKHRPRPLEGLNT